MRRSSVRAGVGASEAPSWQPLGSIRDPPIIGQCPKEQSMADKDYLATRLFTDRDSAEREYQATLARGYNP